MIKLDNMSYAYGGGNNSLSWSHQIKGNLGKKGLIVVVSGGLESGGEQNPEETNSIYFNGILMTKIRDANISQDGMSMYYIRGSQVPAAGTYTVTIYFQGSGTPNNSQGMCASWSGVKDQAVETSNSNTGEDGNTGRAGCAITPLSNDALYLGAWKERTDVDYTQTSSLTPLAAFRNGVNNRMLVVYSIISKPVSTAYVINPVNPESNMFIVASFAKAPTFGGAMI